MITLNQHKRHITSRVIASFSDDREPLSAFGAWFPTETTLDKLVSIEVERNRQLIAVDVQRNTGGNLNTFSNYSQKMYMPPYYEEIFDFTQSQYYDVTFGNRNNPTQSQAFSMIKDTNKRLNTLRNKIKRAIEKQRAQVLQTGIVTLNNGDNIDYKRKAASLKVLAGTAQWGQADAAILSDLKTGGLFIRQQGLSSSNEIDVIMGSGAFSELMASSAIKTSLDNRRVHRGDLNKPRLDKTTGLAFHGQLSEHDFLFNIWTYNEFYEDASGNVVYHMEANNVIMLPDDFKAVTAYAGVPAIKRDKDNAEFPEYIQQVEAEFYMNNYLDPKKKAHWFEIASAPLAVPVSIDRVYTLQVK